MRKRLLSALLAMAMMLTMLPTAAFAAEIAEVAITLDTTELKVGDKLPEATVDTNGATVETKWFKDGETDALTAETFEAEGTYKAEVTITPGNEDSWASAGVEYTLNGSTEKATLTDGKATIENVTVAAAPAGEKTEITAVEITMDTTAIKVNGALPEATITTTPANGADVTVAWTDSENQNVDAADVVKTAGTYTATFTVEPKANFELAEGVTYKVNNTDATAGELKATLIVEEVEVKPVLQDAGFDMDAAKAHEGIEKALKAVRGPDATVSASDVDIETMFVALDNLKADSKYELVVMLGNKEIYREPKVAEEYLTGKTETVVYFTFNQDADKEAGSVAKQEIAAGQYTFILNEVTTEGAAPAKKEVANTTLDVYAVTFENGTDEVTTGSLPEDLFAAKGGSVTIPDCDLALSGYNFVGWKDEVDGKMYHAEDEVILTDDLVLTAQWLNAKIDSPAAGGADVEIAEDAPQAVKDNAAVLGQASVDSDSMEAILENQDVQDAANAVALELTEEEIAEALTAAGQGYDKLQVQVYLGIAPTEYVAPTAEAEAKLVVDITPKYQIVAINSSDETAAPKPVEGKTGDLMDEEGHAAITESVVITLALPAGFVAEENGVYPQVYVEHKGKVLDGTVDDGTTSGTEGDPDYVPAHLTATFTNTDGFSPFVITAANPTKAAVNGVNYASLQAAVDAQSADATVTIEVYEGVEAAVVNKAITINLKAAAGETFTDDELKALLTAGDNVTLADPTVNDHVVTFVFTAKAPASVVAKIGEEEYTSLQAAVDAVENNGTITLVDDLAEKLTAEVKEAITFTIALGNNEKDKVEITVDTAKFNLAATENKRGGEDADKDDVVSITYKVTTKSSGGGMGPIGGGGGGSATYSVNVPTAEHGTVTVNPRNAAKDATVTITVAPDKGYHLESLTVTDKDGNKIELTKVDATKYTFKMPASRVEVKAVFAEGEAPAISFTDVAEGEYYYDAVLWAVNKGITNGLTDTTFGPNASCTRAQMVTFLWRAAGSPEPTSTTTAFTDIDSNEYYYKAVLWAVEKGITTGTTETTFSPSATVTRAQTVTFLYRYAGTPAVSGNNNFTDLEAGEYYVDAVQWAATNGITTGTTETTFSPADNCTRGQIVTFLYRHIVK